jgi:hypothetical protein
MRSAKWKQASQGVTRSFPSDHCDALGFKQGSESVTRWKELSVPGHALRCGPETSVTSPLRWRWFELSGYEDIYPAVEAVGMW